MSTQLRGGFPSPPGTLDGLEFSQRHRPAVLGLLHAAGWMLQGPRQGERHQPQGDAQPVSHLYSHAHPINLQSGNVP